MDIHHNVALATINYFWKFKQHICRELRLQGELIRNLLDL